MKKILFGVLFLFVCNIAFGLQTAKLLDSATATGAGGTSIVDKTGTAFFLTGAVTASTGAASVNVEVSNDNVTWISLGNITLTLGTTVTADGFSSNVPWKYIRGNVASISGTGASVTLWVSYIP